MTTSETNLDSEIIMSTELRPEQQRAIFALLESKNVEAAAKLTGVSSRTIHRWLQDGVFLAELHSIQSGIMHESSLRLLGLQNSVLDKLESLMESSEDERIQLAAAQTIQDYFLRFFELTQVNHRLQQLETMINE